MNIDALDMTIWARHFLPGSSCWQRMCRWVGKCCRAASSLSTLLSRKPLIGRDRCGVLGWEPHGIPAQTAAFAAAILGALGLAWTDTRFSQVQEAIIGVFFVLCATGGLILLANNPHGGEELKDLLVGQILWVDIHNLLPARSSASLCWSLGSGLDRSWVARGSTCYLRSA